MSTKWQINKQKYLPRQEEDIRKRTKMDSDVQRDELESSKRFDQAIHIPLWGGVTFFYLQFGWSEQRSFVIFNVYPVSDLLRDDIQKKKLF